MHRDLKPLNILMDYNNSVIKLIDWGHSEYYFPGQEYFGRVGTFYYAAPEILLHYKMHDYSVDIWSTAVVFAEMAFRKIYLFKPTIPYTNDSRLTYEQTENKNAGIQLDTIAQIMGTFKLKQYANKLKDFVDLSI